MDDTSIYAELIKLSRAGTPCALATLVESHGSAPRKAGAKMLVLDDGTIMGSVGGGKVELDTIEAAREVLLSGSPRTVPLTLTEESGHVCGGRLLVYVEPVRGKPHLVIIGAGHVGKALATFANISGFRVNVADDRPEYVTSGQLPDADETFPGEPSEALAHFGANDSSAIVIATTGFEKDFAAVRAALNTGAGYIGLIGSRRKKAVLAQTLTDEGYSPEEIGRVVIPVGLAIGAETPEEIAVSIVAQLIEVRRKYAATRSCNSPGCRAVTPDGSLQAAPAVG